MSILTSEEVKTQEIEEIRQWYAETKAERESGILRIEDQAKAWDVIEQLLDYIDAESEQNLYDFSKDPEGYPDGP